MANSPLPTPEQLRQLLRCEPETGKLFWLPRPISMFRDGVKFAAERNWKIWNTRYAGKEAFCGDNSRGYHTGRLGGIQMSSHRVIWAMFYGEWPRLWLDHINGDRLDNRIENLREVTPAESSRNLATPRTNTSGVVGVGYRRLRSRPWRAYIKVGGKMRDLGQFLTIEEAVIARKSAEHKFGFHENHGRPGKEL